MPVLARTRLDKNNRTTVPREVRKLAIEWIYEDGRIYVRKAGR